MHLKNEVNNNMFVFTLCILLYSSFCYFFYIEKILQHTKPIYTNYGQLCICKINKYKYGYSVNIFYRR
ncbi:SPV020 hypothetical protein [Swinepox virus]|uniref:Uncharacterized protein C18 n=8 Tax=Swinepox virus TaxID=10276 RepID=VC18_SWPVK|nr:SPV020 hypothetical protein [Swinepox virus]P32217.1 RecName: Full=Uncharacterized protein C18 [Swinepox virus (STRAIN KASZA)]AAC37853.1 ORF C18L [Swinepox virus]AAL69759.1 SPV020 hypothetical protein [Swinepox virus]UED36834.1 SPV020 hypothetical protein [Swinepox virus]